MAYYARDKGVKTARDRGWVEGNGSRQFPEESALRDVLARLPFPGQEGLQGVVEHLVYLARSAPVSRLDGHAVVEEVPALAVRDELLHEEHIVFIGIRERDKLLVLPRVVLYNVCCHRDFSSRCPCSGGLNHLLELFHV